MLEVLSTACADVDRRLCMFVDLEAESRLDFALQCYDISSLAPSGKYLRQPKRQMTQNMILKVT